MRLLALLLLPSLTFAAPVPKGPEKPAVEVTISAKNQLVLNITIQNNGKEPLKLPYRDTPFEHIVVDLVGGNGKQHTIRHDPDPDELARPGTLTIPAGGSKTLSLHTCHSLPELGEPQEKVTFIARLKIDGKAVESKPLTVDR